MNPAPTNSPNSVSRRNWFKASAGLVLAADLWPGRLFAADNGIGDNFTFVALNDAHFFTEKCPAWFERVTTSIKALAPKPEFCLMVGDLAEHGTQNELGPMRDVLRGLGLPYWTVIGNHDYQSDSDRSIYEKLFPGRLNYHFEHRGWQFVGLDSSMGTKYEKTQIQPSAFSWINDHLPKLDQTKPTVVFTHFPLGANVSMRPLNADELLERFLDFNLAAVFNGHFHGYTERPFGPASITTNKCCSISRANHDGTKEKGYFVCTAREGNIERKFIEVPID